MELIIHILMLFIVINCSFKLSFWKLWQTVIYSLIAGLFVAGTWQYAILQSKTQIADYLQNTEALQNMAIIITLESAPVSYTHLPIDLAISIAFSGSMLAPIFFMASFMLSGI